MNVHRRLDISMHRYGNPQQRSEAEQLKERLFNSRFSLSYTNDTEMSIRS